MNATISFCTSIIPHVPVVFFAGKLDDNSCDTVQKEVQDFYCENKHMDGLVFDFSGLDHLNSKAIGQIVRFSEMLSEENKKLVISRPSSDVLKIFDMLGALRLLQVSSTLDEVKNIFSDSHRE